MVLSTLVINSVQAAGKNMYFTHKWVCSMKGKMQATHPAKAY